MDITTRHAVIAAPVTLPLLPARATPAVEGSGLDGLLADFDRLPTNLQDVAAALIHGLAEYERKRRGVVS